MSSELGAEFVVICTQDLREGRSMLPSHGPNTGIIK